MKLNKTYSITKHTVLSEFLPPFSQLLETEMSFLVHMGRGFYTWKIYRPLCLLRRVWSAKRRFVKRREI